MIREEIHMSNKENNITLEVIDILENHGLNIISDNYESHLEMDSIQYISVLVALEEQFGITISDEDLLIESPSINTFVDIVRKEMGSIV